MTGQRIPMSQDTFEKLTRQLEHLRKIDRPTIIKEIADARGQGDLNENAEYHAAKERQGLLEQTISELEDKLARVEIIKASAADSPHVIFGATVSVRDIKKNKENEYTIVSPEGVDLMENKISLKSPIGKGLMGKKVGDVADIETPKGNLKLEILSFH